MKKVISSHAASCAVGVAILLGKLKETGGKGWGGNSNGDDEVGV